LLSFAFIGVRFHGLRGLTAAKIANDLIVTGPCDRDVRVWRRHDGTRGVLTGGTRGVLFIWRVDLSTGLLYRLLVSQLCDANAKCKLRITVIAVSPALRLLVALSDASLRFYDYSAGQNSLALIDWADLNSVGVSASFCRGSDTTL
jgi:hypothetical protein